MIDENSASSSEYDVEHQTPDLGAGGLDLPADLDPVAIREPDVEDGHVRLEVAQELQALLRRARLADDLHVILGFEQRMQACPHQFVIDRGRRPGWPSAQYCHAVHGG